MVHRDIKPANVFLDGDGNYFLGDFGIASDLRDRRAGEGRRVGRRLCVAGAAPRAAVGPASDIAGMASRC